MYFGAENSIRKEYHIKQINSFLKIGILLNTGVRTALIYGKIKAYLKSKGTPIPENDIWIAAIAKEHQLPIVTEDKHFKLIPDIEIIRW